MTSVYRFKVSFTVAVKTPIPQEIARRRLEWFLKSDLQEAATNGAWSDGLSVDSREEEAIDVRTVAHVKVEAP